MANIGATTAFYKVETSLTRANSEVSKSMERLATGKQNANAGDRSSYVAMADTFRLDFVGTKAGIKGASVTMGYLETGMRVLDSASALLSRLQELAVLGANDTNTTADHEAINLEAEAIADEFNRLMTTSTYKGRDVFNETAGSLYVAMGGRDQEMTFGIGEIDYSDMYVAEARTIAGATVTTPKAFGFSPTLAITNTGTLDAGKTYVVNALPAAADRDFAEATEVGGKLLADTSAVFRAGDDDDTLVTTGDMAVGDVLVVDVDTIAGDLNGDTDISIREVVTGDSAFVAG
jgi:flagellin-like hook-associated protein FlgL